MVLAAGELRRLTGGIRKPPAERKPGWVKTDSGRTGNPSGDCAVRALANAEVANYEDIWDSWQRLLPRDRNPGVGMDPLFMREVAQRAGYENVTDVWRDGRTSGVARFLAARKDDGYDYIMEVDRSSESYFASHVVFGGRARYYDTWDSGDWSVLKAWRKKRE